MSNETPREQTVDQGTVEEILAKSSGGDISDTASMLVEIYESAERAYRAAVLIGEAIPHLSQSTNY